MEGEVKARAFKIHDGATLQRVAAMISKLPVSEEHALFIEVGDYQEQRSSAQNRLLHAILRDVAEEIEVDGKRFSSDAWKEMFRRKFIGTEEITLPTGERLERGISTTTLTRGQMAEAIDRFSAWLASEFAYLAEVAA